MFNIAWAIAAFSFIVSLARLMHNIKHSRDSSHWLFYGLAILPMLLLSFGFTTLLLGV